MKAFILVGGKGTRLRPITEDLPKPMVTVNGKPFLLYLLNYLFTQGITDFVLLTGYKAEKIVDYFGDGSKFGFNIKYSHEKEFLGTAGALKNAEKFIENQPFLLLNGDIFFPFNLQEIKKTHETNKSKCTLALTHLKDCSRFGHVITDNERITSFKEKGFSSPGDINVGIYIVDPSVLDMIPLRFSSIEHEIFPKLIESDSLFGHRADGYFIDIGTPESYNQFQKDIYEGLFKREKSN